MVLCVSLFIYSVFCFFASSLCWKRSALFLFFSSSAGSRLTGTLPLATVAFVSVAVLAKPNLSARFLRTSGSIPLILALTGAALVALGDVVSVATLGDVDVAGIPNLCARISFFAVSFNWIPNLFARSKALSASSAAFGETTGDFGVSFFVTSTTGAATGAASVLAFLSKTMGVNLKLELVLVIGVGIVISVLVSSSVSSLSSSSSTSSTGARGSSISLLHR